MKLLSEIIKDLHIDVDKMKSNPEVSMDTAEINNLAVLIDSVKVSVCRGYVIEYDNIKVPEALDIIMYNKIIFFCILCKVEEIDDKYLGIYLGDELIYKKSLISNDRNQIEYVFERYKYIVSCRFYEFAFTIKFDNKFMIGNPHISSNTYSYKYRYNKDGLAIQRINEFSYFMSRLHIIDIRLLTTHIIDNNVSIRVYFTELDMNFINSRVIEPIKENSCFVMDYMNNDKLSIFKVERTGFFTKTLGRRFYITTFYKNNKRYGFIAELLGDKSDTLNNDSMYISI